MKLSSLEIGEKGFVKEIICDYELKTHLEEIGFTKNAEVEVVYAAPLGEPIMYYVNGERISLRHDEASCIEIEPIIVTRKSVEIKKNECCINCNNVSCCGRKERNIKGSISVALVGNPNCGKTTLFNSLTCNHERVGNYAGVTVELKTGKVYFQDYIINIIDLPGINSMNTFGEEEEITRNFIFEKKNEVIFANVIDITHLRKGLLLTSQLKSLKNTNIVCVLNMFDKFQSINGQLDINCLSEELSVKCIPIAAEKEYGMKDFLTEVINIYERRGEEEEGGDINPTEDLLENENNISVQQHFDNIDKILNESKFSIEEMMLKQSFNTWGIDKVVLNKHSGLILFIIFIIIMFQTTFSIGGYISSFLSLFLNKITLVLDFCIPICLFKDLLLNGVIPGVEAILIFIPQIFILYSFLFFLEDCGYMNRIVFLIDKIMQKIGLSGNSFIPLITSFGCNVPGVLATKIIKNRSNKVITCLLAPMMSCPAKLPIYALVTSLYFSKNIQMCIIIGLYLLGIIIAIICGKIFNLILKNKEKDISIITFPEYKFPNVIKTFSYSFANVKHFLIKIGSIVTFASVLLWALEYFPQKNRDDISESYIATIGKNVDGILKPNGFNWKIDVALVSGVIAKEVIAPVLMLLYKNDVKDGNREIKKRMINDGIGIPSILSLLIFILFYFPCMGTLLAIKKEIGSLWMIVSLFLNTILAYLLSFLTFYITSLFFF